MLTLDQIRAVPKVLLHDHLDGGLRPQTVLELAHEIGYRDLPGDNVEELTRLDALQVGIAAWRLGAGRARKEDPVSATAGVICLAKPGDEVRKGQPLLELHADDENRFAPALAALDGAIEVSEAPPPSVPLVIEHIGPA